MNLEVKVSAQKEIAKVHGRGYNNLILSVQWSRESNVILPLHLGVLTDPRLEPRAMRSLRRGSYFGL